MLELLIPLNLQLNHHLIERAWEDAQFQQQLVSQPQKTLEKALNIQLSDQVTYQVLTDESASFHLVLPYVIGGISVNEKQKIYQQAAAQYDSSWQAQLVALFEKTEDRDFKQALIQSPKNTLSEFLGLRLPDEIHIHLFENSATRRYIVLPFNPTLQKSNVKKTINEFDLALLAGAISSAPVTCEDTKRKC